MPKLQLGTVTKKSGKWLGHYSLWSKDATGQKNRVQRGFVIGIVERTTLTNARRTLRQRIEQETGLRVGSHRITLAWFIEHRWKPLREGTWRRGTRETNEWILSHIIKADFGDDTLSRVDTVQLQRWLNELATKYSRSLVKHVHHF
jgi:hypothetical protein